MKKKNRTLTGFLLLVFAGAIAVPFIDGDKAANLLVDPLFWMVVLVVFFLILASAAIHSALDSIKYYVLRKEGRLEEATEAEVAAATGEDFFSRLWRKMQDAKPIERESEIDLDHNYDGIRELDNNLPPWWLWGFYLSIAFAVVYLIRYHVVQSAPLQEGEYQAQMAAAEVQKAEYLKNAANLVDENNVVMLTDEALISDGSKIFNANCAVCHAADGGGGVGPNLTDPYWIHGGDIKAIFSTIKYGVPAKGMIPWKDQLNPSQMQKVASYIMTLKGTTPADPKDAEGELYTPVIEEEISPADSSSASDPVEESVAEDTPTEETEQQLSAS